MTEEIGYSTKKDSPSPWQARIITLFPEMFPGPLNFSLSGKALSKNLWDLQTINIRDFGTGKHQSVDDTPAGGGAGMILKPNIVDNALRAATQDFKTSKEAWPLIYVTPHGKKFTQDMAFRFSKAKGIVLVCGRYEGIDTRVINKWNLEEVSLGDFILSGGELVSYVIIEAVVRLLPGVLGNKESILEESFSNGLLEYPQYTKPSSWDGHKIPEVLMSGNHQEIKQWRKKQSEKITKEKRPDLWQKFKKT